MVMVFSATFNSYIVAVILLVEETEVPRCQFVVEYSDIQV
jgi:hypothetical protein